MSDQSPPNQTPSGPEPSSVDVTARLANLTSPRPSVASIWQRREASAPPPAPAADSTEAEASAVAASRATLTPTSTASAPSTGGGIGRLTRIDAAELWTDANAMSAWIAANADTLTEFTGVESVRFQAPSDGVVLGTAADGGAVCVVCEVGPSSDEALGALLRTAAVQDGGTVVWLNGGASDSHVAALSWLNRATPPRFFLARATGVRIDGSASAPMFELLVRPPRAAEPAEETTDAPQRRVEDHVPEG